MAELIKKNEGAAKAQTKVLVYSSTITKAINDKANTMFIPDSFEHAVTKPLLYTCLCMLKDLVPVLSICCTV